MSKERTSLQRLVITPIVRTKEILVFTRKIANRFAAFDVAKVNAHAHCMGQKEQLYVKEKGKKKTQIFVGLGSDAHFFEPNFKIMCRERSNKVCLCGPKIAFFKNVISLLLWTKFAVTAQRKAKAKVFLGVTLGSGTTSISSLPWVQFTQG